MTREELQNIISSKPYDFLRENEHLGKHLMYLTIGGSHAYGTSQDGSDIDIRGVALNSKEDLLGLGDFEHYVDVTTDTTVFGFNKAVNLMCAGNPNMLEQLGNKDDLVISYNPATKLLMDNKKLFLSKRVIYSFGGFTGKLVREADVIFNGLRTPIGSEEVRKRTQKKLNKTVTNAVRLYYMLFDILEKEEIITYRENELDILRAIRNGRYDYKKLRDEVIPVFEKRLAADKKETSLPDNVNMETVNELAMAVNEQALLI